MELNGIKINQKTEFTRRCIGEAVIKLLQSNSFEQLKISEISKVAGVSRTSFYQYYTSPYEVLNDYLNIIVSEYLLADKKLNDDDNYFATPHIIFSFNFFDKYSQFFLTLYKSKLYSVLIEAVNDFMIKHIKLEQNISVYKLYAYAGALLNSFLKWEENGKKEKVEDIAIALENFVYK
ncbi:MAG: TetR/AcrR family transcriptional regulator [Lachnospiraceae bacterium]|nr:TetR/AcrR family transcriptional regulator [Lachnospiraceae bacterium]